MSCSLPPTVVVNGGHSCSPTILRWGMQNSQDGALTHLVSRKSNATTFRVLVSSGRGNFKGNSKSDVIMVDPLEAKRLAAKQMLEIQAEEKFERQRRIEAINGAWAMIGLTAGLVIEGRTGDGILAQLEGYWSLAFGFVAPIFPLEAIHYSFDKFVNPILPTESIYSTFEQFSSRFTNS